MKEKLKEFLKKTPDVRRNPETVHSGEILGLHNHENLEPSLESGCGTLVLEDEAFHVYAFFSDRDIYNVARKDNERTWETGDVCEFFLQPYGKDDYFEFHVTPDNITLQLHLPPVEKQGSIPFEKQIFNSGLKTKTEVNRLKNYWYSEMTIPFTGLEITKKQVANSRFAICRYNYSHQWEKPEISSTAYFQKGGFHDPTSWHKLEVEQA